MAIADDKRASKEAGWRIFLYYFAAFAVVASVNSVFVYKAYKTHTGDAADNPYELGLNYNNTLTEAAEEQALGWKPVIDVRKDDGGLYDITLRVTDNSGKTIGLDSISGRIVRPVNAHDDVAATFAKQRDGSYNARVSLQMQGLWEVRAVLKTDGNKFHVVKRIVIH